jgi:putative glutamine amidotransferase
MITEADVAPHDQLLRSPERKHIAILVSLNFPGMTDDIVALHIRFIRNVLREITRLGATYQILDSSQPFSLAATVRLDADALLVLGGGDIDPTLMGVGLVGHAPNSYGVDAEADRVSMHIIRSYAQVDRPVLGICRGSQLINVSWGGTIIPDIEDYQLHRGGPNEDFLVDERITVRAGTRLASMIGVGPVTVRSGHHQAVDRVAEGFQVSAYADDGVSEAIEHPTRWVVGVQFHPEDDDGGERELRLLFTALLDATQPSRGRVSPQPAT